MTMMVKMADQKEIENLMDQFRVVDAMVTNFHLPESTRAARISATASAETAPLPLELPGVLFALGVPACDRKQ